MRELVRNAISERRANSGVWSKLSRLPHQAARQVRDFDLVTAATQAALERAARLPGETTSETSMPIATGNQLLDEKARHAGLSCARIVQQQETQRLTRPHSLPDRRDLMAPAARRAMCGPRATGSNKCARRMRWASETKTEQGAIETRGTAGFDDFEALLVVPVQQLVRDRAGRSFIWQLQRLGTVPLDADNSGELVRQNASHGAAQGLRAASFALPGLSFCSKLPCDMLARLKTSLRTLEDD